MTVSWAYMALVIVTFLAYHLFYSHTARMYTLLPLFAGWVIWSYWKAVTAADSVPLSLWISLLASTSLILYLHYFGIIILAAIGLYHLLFIEKHRRWWRISLVMALAGLLFMPWLPVAIEGFSNRISLADTRLPLLDSLLTIFQIFSNGLFFIPLAATALAALRYRRLSKAEQFILLITAFILLTTALVNEITPILVERRMRYMTIITVPFCLSYAIGLRLMPRWNILRFPMLILLIASFVAFYRSEDLLLHANKRVQNLDKIPHYQDFIYESENLPGHNELILSFHSDTPITVNKTLLYYRAELSKWAHLAHMSYDEGGALVIQSGLSTYGTVDAIADNSIGIWVIYNPQQTDLPSLDVYANWLSQHYHACRRYVDKPDNVIDYYLRSDVPCELVTSENPFAIRYDNGTELGNLIVDQERDLLTVYLRWLKSLEEMYSFTVQIFDTQADKVQQDDRVISGEPVDVMKLDISSLPSGEYTVKLIVYDFESKASQPGMRVDGAGRFEREIEIARLSVNS